MIRNRNTVDVNVDLQKISKIFYIDESYDTQWPTNGYFLLEHPLQKRTGCDWVSPIKEERSNYFHFRLSLMIIYQSFIHVCNIDCCCWLSLKLFHYRLETVVSHMLQSHFPVKQLNCASNSYVCRICQYYRSFSFRFSIFSLISCLTQILEKQSSLTLQLDRHSH